MDIGHLPSAAEPLAKPVSRDRSIGALLVDSGKLSPADAESVLRHARDQGMRFGDAAVKLGFVRQADVQYALALQFDYPYLAPDNESVSKEVIAAFAPFSAPIEALRALRTQLMLRWFDSQQPNKSLAVVSPSRGDGRSYLAANLAVVFSQLGERTLLVDADLRYPRQHVLFRLSDRVGLSTLLSGRADGDAVQRVPGLLSLSVLPAGAVPPNPQELLGRAAFATLLHELSLRFDVIVIDTPAAALGADFQMATGAAKGALLVARRHVTRAAEAHQLSERIEHAGAKTVGAVLNER